MPDWAEEGLLEDLEGEDRDARVDLLDRLAESGAGIDELRRAVKDGRLAMLPVERALGGDCELTAVEVAETAGIDTEVLLKQRRALGLPQPADGERAFNEDDVEAARHLKQFLDAGFEPEDVVEVTRVVGEGMMRVADAVASLTARSLLSAGDTERDLGLKFAEAAEVLGPVMSQELEYVFKLQLREIVRNEIVSQAERVSGKLPDSETMGVCFADLVGFTKLGEELPPDEIGKLAGKLTSIAGDVVEPPVKFVKSIGDAVMLVSRDSEALVHTAITLVRAADDAGRDFPQLRSGVARGETIGRGGDWYGRPVNVASRVCAVARPGSVLVTDGVHEDVESAFRWSPAGKRRLKGVKDPVPLYRARRLKSDADVYRAAPDRRRRWW